MTTTADSKKRIVLPSAKPGEVFEVLTEGEGHFRVIRLERAPPPMPMSQSDCLSAMNSAPLRPRMSWEKLRTLTRGD
jgi:hypothetical protein